jgi:hypothetical protein
MDRVNEDADRQTPQVIGGSMKRPKLSSTHGLTVTRGRGRVIAIEDGSIVWLAVINKRGEHIARIKFNARRVWREATLPEIGGVVSYTEIGDRVTEVWRA